MRYFASQEWRGRLKVSTMRCFDDLDSAKDYIREEDWLCFRIYEVCEDKPGKLVWSEGIRTKEGEEYDHHKNGRYQGGWRKSRI